MCLRIWLILLKSIIQIPNLHNPRFDRKSFDQFCAMPSRSRRNFGGRRAQQKNRKSGSRPQRTRSKGSRKQRGGEAH